MDGCRMCTYGWMPYVYVLCVYALYMPGPDGTDVLEKIGASFGSEFFLFFIFFYFYLCVYALYMTGPDGTDALCVRLMCVCLVYDRTGRHGRTGKDWRNIECVLLL